MTRPDLRRALCLAAEHRRMARACPIGAEHHRTLRRAQLLRALAIRRALRGGR